MTEHVPTVAELAHQGLATLNPVKKGETATYRVSDEGHALMGAALRKNGLEARARNERKATENERHDPRCWSPVGCAG